MMTNLYRCSTAVILLLMIVSVAPAGQALPRQMTIGGHSLVLNGEAVRSKLFGLIELYRIGLYLPSQTSSSSDLRADVPKALRLDALHDTRSDRLPESWRDELTPVLLPAEMQVLRAAYAGLRKGDIVTISYVPNRGSRITIDDVVLLQADGRELMHAFLDQWLGQDPVSDEIKDALLNRPRR